MSGFAGRKDNEIVEIKGKETSNMGGIVLCQGSRALHCKENGLTLGRERAENENNFIRILYSYEAKCLSDTKRNPWLSLVEI